MKSYLVVGVVLLMLIVGAVVYSYRPGNSSNDFVQYQSNAGISFFYPKGEKYSFEEGSPVDAPDGLEQLIVVKEKSAAAPVEGSEVPPSMAILLIHAEKDMSVDTWLQQFGGKYIGPRITPATPMIIAGEEGRYFEATGLYNTQVAIVKRLDKIVMVIGAYIDRESDLYKDFFTIASSVQFK